MSFYWLVAFILCESFLSCVEDRPVEMAVGVKIQKGYDDTISKRIWVNRAGDILKEIQVGFGQGKQKRFYYQYNEEHKIIARKEIRIKHHKVVHRSYVRKKYFKRDFLQIQKYNDEYYIFFSFDSLKNNRYYSYGKSFIPKVDSISHYSIEDPKNGICVVVINGQLKSCVKKNKRHQKMVEIKFWSNHEIEEEIKYLYDSRHRLIKEIHFIPNRISCVVNDDSSPFYTIRYFYF